MKNKRDELDLELNLIVKKYENKTVQINNDLEKVFDRILFYKSIEKEFVTDLNSLINPFLLKYEKEMTTDEKAYLNSIISKHERNMVYGIKFPSELDE